jgi:glycosyltransferase involved in cell wall biosynthesis
MRRNGTVDFTLDLVDSLQGSGSYRCTLLNYRGPQPGGVAPRSGLTVRTPSFRGARLLPPPLKARYVGWRRDRTLAAALQDADLVVTASDNGPFLRQTVRIATRLKKPLCCIVHNNLSEKFGLPRHREWSKAQTLELFRRVDKIVCVSRGIRDDLARDLPERAPDILTIVNGIDLERLDRLAAADPGCPGGSSWAWAGSPTRRASTCCCGRTRWRSGAARPRTPWCWSARATCAPSWSGWRASSGCATAWSFAATPPTRFRSWPGRRRSAPRRGSRASRSSPPRRRRSGCR